MNFAPVPLAMLLQQPDANMVGLSHGQITILMIFAIAVSISVLIQSAILIAFAMAAAKARKEVLELSRQLHGKAMPLLHTVQTLVDESTPKIKNVIADLESMAATTKAKVAEIDSLTTEIVTRTRQQTRRVDGIVTNTLTGVEHLRESITHAILAPVRQAAGFLAGAKAMVERLKEHLPNFMGAVESRMPTQKVRRERDEMFGRGEDYHA